VLCGDEIGIGFGIFFCPSKTLIGACSLTEVIIPRNNPLVNRVLAPPESRPEGLAGNPTFAVEHLPGINHLTSSLENMNTVMNDDRLLQVSFAAYEFSLT
ncbi:hypothetical protein AKJ16_DCAP25471, partial [Drosera capensis]